MNFVTGATGLVGASIARHLLQSGLPVRALKRTNSNTVWTERYFAFHGQSEAYKQLQWVDGDIHDVLSLEDAMRGATHVYHAAALVSFHPKDAQVMLVTNGEGTANVVNTALALGGMSLCHISSTAALGRSRAGEAIDHTKNWENSELNTPYAISKYAAESEVWRGAQEGLNVVVVNPSIIIGPGNPNRSSGALLKQVAKGLIRYPAGSNGFVGLEDVATAALHVSGGQHWDRRFLLNGWNAPYKALFEKMAEVLDAKAPSSEASVAQLRFIARLHWLREKLTGKRASLTRSSALNVSNQVTYDGRLIEETGFQYMPFDHHLKAAADFYLQHQSD